MFETVVNIFTFLLWCEVEYVTPFVIPVRKFCLLHLSKKLCIEVVLMRNKFYILWWFYNWVRLGKQHYLKVLAVTQSQLLRCNHECAIFTVSHKRRTSAGTHRNHWIFTKVNSRLGHLVMYVNMTFSARLKLEHLTLQWARNLIKKFTWFIFELVVIRIKVLSFFVPWKFLFLTLTLCRRLGIIFDF